MPRTRPARRLVLTAALFAPILLAATIHVSARLNQVELDNALVSAVRHNDASEAHALLGAGANARARGAVRRSVVEIVRQLFWPEPPPPGNVECLAIILTGDALRHLRHPAPLAGTDSIAADLIEHGADIETDLGEYGKPLNVASVWRLHRTVKALLARHADVHPTGLLGRTPLFDADDFTADGLIKAGADPNVEDVSGDTALCYAKTERTATLLIERGVNVNHVSHKMSVVDSIAALKLSPTANLAGICKLLRAHGALTATEIRARAERTATGHHGGDHIASSSGGNHR